MSKPLPGCSEPTIIPSQRHLFDMPEDVAYLNCAYMSPLMNEVVAAGDSGIRRKATPWSLTPQDFFTETETLRARFAQLINADSADIAIIPSVSYGIAVAAKNLPLAAGQEVLVLEDQFPSNIYSWKKLAQSNGATVNMIRRRDAAPGNGPVDWTTALLENIHDRTGIVALPHCHWTDGALIDLMSVAKKIRTHGAKLVLDITQSGGAMPIDMQTIQPDFLICACYKWLMGPYSLGFLYVAPEWQQGDPLEETWLARRGSEDFRRLVDYQDEYQPGAIRFDMGERSQFHLAPMANAALKQLLDWGVKNIAATLKLKTDKIAAKARGLGLTPLPGNLRGGHYLGLSVPGGVPEALPAALADSQIFVSVRGDSIRVTPHLYNNEHDADRLIDALTKLL
ncbi:MAG: aminotransferase class V-fold PLP-dependent enzyme [Fimbriimonadaceae bacterium]|nr:aminotransferase class V-fold PLP-dependent enzyme [Alphaproteobacteria bacterium]